MTYAKKGLGQHFLMHTQTAERIVGAAGVTKEDTVLEIGPGTGMLTDVLLAKAGKVYAIETDQDLYPVLKERFAAEIEEDRFVLIEGDVRSFDTASIPGDYLLVANIPYYITGEIIRTFLTTRHKPRSMTLLVQKEVAERIAREKKESLLSLSVKAYGTPRYDFTVPKGAFKPAPKVDSAVLTISNIRSPFATDAEEAWFFEILRAGFAHKRKRLAKNLEDVASKLQIEPAFSEAELGLESRPEDVSLSSWFSLARALS